MNEPKRTPTTQPTSRISSKTVLAISSGGGHWVQLLRLRPVLDNFNTVYSTVDEHYRTMLKEEQFYTLRDSSFSNLRSLPSSIISSFTLLLKTSPNIIISTGAAPGAITLALGKLMGITTIWIDSIANTRRLSISGILARPLSDLHFCQWPDLASKAGSSFIGNIL